MKKFLLCSAAFALLGGSALAADLPTYEAPSMITAPISAFSWSGFYAGVQTGYSWGDFDVSYDDFDGVEADGFLLGGFAGYNMQFNSFVVGAEADLEWTGIDGDDDEDEIDFDLGVSWQGSLRARAGFAVDRFLIYGTAGLAIADFDADIDAAIDDEDEEGGTELGWTVGAGVDFAVTDNVFVRGEYRYADFGEVASIGDEEVEFDSHTVRVGAGFKF